jgi:hypothetical protein
MNLRLKKLGELEEYSPILCLIVLISNSSLEKGTTILINCKGLISPLQFSRMDGYTYFGFYDINETQNIVLLFIY